MMMDWGNISDDEQMRTLSDKDNGRGDAPQETPQDALDFDAPKSTGHGVILSLLRLTSNLQAIAGGPRLDARF